MRLCVLMLLLPLAACLRDETVAAYGASDQLWTLQTIDGQPTPAPVSLSFGVRGAVSGSGPCNSFTARQTAPYPWFALEQFQADTTPCPPDQQEPALFATLQSMTLSEVSGSQLILSDDAGREMLFSAAPRDD